MEDWIAGVFAVLGTLMVLSGGTLIVLRALGRLGIPAEPAAAAPTTTAAEQPAARRFSLRKLSPASQLIGWAAPPQRSDGSRHDAAYGPWSSPCGGATCAARTRRAGARAGGTVLGRGRRQRPGVQTTVGSACSRR
jgi:hypothetical protein